MSLFLTIQKCMFLVATCSVLMCTKAVQPMRTGCAPYPEVHEALHRAELSASQWLGEEEARELIASLKRNGKRHSDGTICFSRSDFQHFGTLASQLYHEVETTDRQFRPEFSGSEEDESLGGSSQCVCLVCQRSFVSYCDRSFRAKCCPMFCRNIFSAMAVAALSGVEGSGLESCCDDGSEPCPSAKPNSRSAQKTKVKATETPNFNFHRNTPGQSVSDDQGRALPTVTPAVEGASDGLQTDDLSGQNVNPTMEVSHGESLSAGPSMSQPWHQDTDFADQGILGQEVEVTEAVEDDDVPFPTAEGDA